MLTQTLGTNEVTYAVCTTIKDPNKAIISTTPTLVNITSSAEHPVSSDNNNFTDSPESVDTDKKDFEEKCNETTVIIPDETNILTTTSSKLCDIKDSISDEAKIETINTQSNDLSLER